MPQRQLSPADWAMIVRLIGNTQHWLRVVNGSVQRERLDTSGEIADLEHALKLLGADRDEAVPLRGARSIPPR